MVVVCLMILRNLVIPMGSPGSGSRGIREGSYPVKGKPFHPLLDREVGNSQLICDISQPQPLICKQCDPCPRHLGRRCTSLGDDRFQETLVVIGEVDDLDRRPAATARIAFAPGLLAGVFHLFLDHCHCPSPIKLGLQWVKQRLVIENSC